MARGQDAPNKSMQVDPYVQQSIASGKEQANNRLIAAMQTTSAEKRQNQAGTQQAVMQGAQMAQERQMLAAQQAQQDKRAAEAEAARRDDQKFQSMQNKLGQEFQAEQTRLQREFIAAQSAEDRAAEDKIRRDMLDAQQLQFRDNLESNERMVNAIVSMTKGMANNELAQQKVITLADNEAQKTKRTTEIYDVRKQNIIKGAKQDKLMDLPVPPEFKMSSRPVEASKIMANLVVGLGKPSQIVSLDKELREENKAFAQSARPKEVLQTQINKNQSKINIMDLMPDHTYNLVDKMVENKVTAEDITVAWAGIKGMKEVIDEKLGAVKENSPEEKFWRKERGDLDLMENGITQLMYSDKKISETETVGARVRYALGPIEGFSLGSLLEQKQRLMKEAGVQNPMALYGELTKGLNPIQLEQYPEGASDYLKSLIDRRNAARMSVYPELGGGQ